MIFEKRRGYDDYVATGGYTGLRKAVDLTPEAITKIVIEAKPARARRWWICDRGRNGRLYQRKKRGPHYLAVNADESEPGTFKDRYPADI